MSKNKFEEFDDELEYDDEDEGAQIDWAGMFRKLYAKRKLLIISAIVTIVVATPLILTIPKFYAVEVKLAPELSSGRTSSSGGLSSLMSSFGLGSSAANGDDAIGPLLYPDLMNSTTFIVSLFDIPVVSQEGNIKATYYDYLAKHQKRSIFSSAIGGLLHLILSPFLEKGEVPVSKVNAGALTESQLQVATVIAHNVVCAVDENTGVITIDVIDQDPVICATIADSACQRLQEFITEYRSKKARRELQNVEKQYKQAQTTYEAAKHRVEDFNNSNWDLVDQNLIVQKQDLTNKMQIAFQTMSTFNNQRIAARSKYQSSIPVYTVLDGACVPIDPAGPNRKMYLFFLLFLVIGSESAWILFKDKVKSMFSSLKEEETEIKEESLN